MISFRGQNKPNISKGILGFWYERVGDPHFFFPGLDFFLSNSFCTSAIEMSQPFLGQFGPLVLTFCGPSSNFEGNWPVGLPYFNPC